MPRISRRNLIASGIALSGYSLFGNAAWGSPLMDTRDVPHGAVASVFYYSHVLKTTRRMHIYIPPGYEERIRTEKGDSS
jgi:enterochelin esterase-like enzyme